MAGSLACSRSVDLLSIRTLCTVASLV
jgi:hypothetical protein